MNFWKSFTEIFNFSNSTKKSDCYDYNYDNNGIKTCPNCYTDYRSRTFKKLFPDRDYEVCLWCYVILNGMTADQYFP